MKKILAVLTLAPALALATPENHPHFVTKAELDARLAEVEQVTVNETYITQEEITSYTANPFAVFGAMASIPALGGGQDRGVGIGVSTYKGVPAVGLGYLQEVDNISIKATVGLSQDDRAAGLGATIGF